MQIDHSGARELLEALVAAFSMLAGVMAYVSGFAAAQSLANLDPPHLLAQRINEAIGKGFLSGAPLAVAARIIVVWT